MYWNAILADTAAPSTAPTASTTQAASPQPAQQPPVFSNIFFFIVPALLIMYVLMIRQPQQQAKQQAKLLAALKSGDKVVTSSGIIGVVITVKDKSVSLRSADAKMEVLKSSVTQILESGDAAPSTT